LLSEGDGFEILPSAGARWYANLPLNDWGLTTASVAFQNQALVQTINTMWVPYNLLEHDGETLTVRVGDSLRFTAWQPNSWFGSFALSIAGQQIATDQMEPLVHTFNEAGTYTVSGTFSEWFGGSQSGEVTINVIGGTFPEESPACLVGRTREWSFEGMPSNMVYEVDHSVEMEFRSCEAGITNQSSLVTKVALKATKTNGEHIMLARLYEGGPILASTKLSTFWVQNAVDGYFWTVERFDDSELWEVESIAKNLPDTVDLQIKVFVAGVTFDDYTLERWITNADYDELGEYKFRLFHPNDSQHSTCHTFKLYQNGQFIGEAFSGGQNNIEEE
jgi:plastocyanin